MSVATLVVVARLLLAATFAVAAVAKLADRPGTRRAVEQLGAPARLARVLALVVPVVELIVAALLLPARTAVIGAIGSLALLLVFSAALGRALVRGRTVDCRCFGRLTAGPVGWRTLARNAVLAAAAAATLVGSLAAPDANAFAWLGELDGPRALVLVFGVLAAAIVAIVILVFLSLIRSYGRVLTRLERLERTLARAGLDLGESLGLPERGLTPGTPVPSFAARTVADEEVSPDSIVRAGLPALLVFTSPNCEPCAALMPAVAGWQRTHADRVSIIVASSGSPNEARAEAEQHGLERVLADDHGRLSELFGTPGTPSAVVISPDGTVGSWVASGYEWIAELVEQVVAGRSDVDGIRPGTEAPLLELPSLDGPPRSSAELLGRDTLLIFWNPGCGHCRSIHGELLAREATADGVHPRVVVVSSGTAESVRAEGFRSQVVFDPHFEVAAAFGAHGTPMAVLVDADGRIGSSVVAGADAVLELLEATPTPVASAV